MRKQVELIQSIMTKVLYYPFNGEASYFTVNYEVFYVIKAILKGTAVDTKLTLHITQEQIQELYAAGITRDDVDEVRRISGQNIKLLQDAIGEALSYGPAVIYSDSDLIRALNRNPTPENKLLTQKIIDTQTSPTDHNYVFAPYRLEALRGLMMIANVPPILAMRKLTKCTEEQVKMQWWLATETKGIIKGYALEFMQKGTTAREFADNVLGFIQDGKEGILNVVQQARLRERDPVHILHLFSDTFLQSLNTELKKAEIEKELLVWPDHLTRFVNQSADTEQLDALNAHEDFMRCYEQHKCHGLFSQKNIAKKIADIPQQIFSFPANGTIEAAIPQFLSYNPEYLNNIIMARNNISPSLVLTALTFAATNSPVCEVAALSLLSLFLLRKRLWSLNPLRYFTICKRSETASMEERERLRPAS
jgi:hypothetical protein